MGRSTCASVSALSFDAQPAQLERLVNRICFPDGACSKPLMTPRNVGDGYFEVDYNKPYAACSLYGTLVGVGATTVGDGSAVGVGGTVRPLDDAALADAAAVGNGSRNGVLPGTSITCTLGAILVMY